MTVTDLGWLEPSTDIPRDRWKRPLVVPPEGGQPIGYTRSSTLAGTLDDTYNLQSYKMRQVARGLSLRPDLQLRVASLGPEPDRYTQTVEHKRWKAALNEICEAADEAAGGSVKSGLGTALHAYTDRIDKGLDLGIVPETYKPHLNAYVDATRDLTAVHIERFLVCDELQTAGTTDRVVRIDGYGDQLFIADTKSGNIDFNHKIAVQLAVYAHSVLYNHETKTRQPLGDIDLDRALIIALNAALGTCKLVWIDIASGWEAAKQSVWTREWRKRDNLSQPYMPNNQIAPTNPAPVQEQARDLTVEAAVALEAGIRNAKTNDELIQLWTVAGSVWTDTHTAMAAARKAELASKPQLTVVS